MENFVMKLENILRMTQRELKNAVTEELQGMGYTRVKSQRGFVYAAGRTPVLLVAHLDTVHRQPVQTICYSHDGAVLMSPEGIGGDDRAGVYAVLEIARSSNCHVLFCEDEETGGRGAREFANTKIRPKVNYIVELDRRGGNDAVFYGCDNPAFTEFVLDFDFQEAHGTFSDISVIAPRLGVAAVNISAGYYNEHSRHEVINVNELRHNIERVTRMAQTSAGFFEYTERPPFSRFEQLSMPYEEISFFDLIGRESRTERTKRLMRLPDEACLKMSGQMIEAVSGTYLMDDGGTVYDYLYDLDAAVESEHTRAYSASGLPLRFDADDAVSVKVIPLERALEILESA
jgi:hypothetical protein